MEENITPVETEQPKKKKDRLKINVVLNVIYQFLVIVVPFVTAPYISRVLQPEGVGIYEYTYSLATFFTMFASFGTLTYGTMAIAQRRESKKEYTQTFWEIETLAVFLAVTATSAWLVFSTFYTDYKIFMYLLGFHVIAACFDISWLYAGLEKFKYTIGVNALSKIATMVLIFIFVKTRDDLWIYVLINSVGLLAGNLTMWLFLFRVVGRYKIKFANMKGHFKETFVFFIPTIATTIYTVLDKALIGLLIQGTNESGEKLADIENGYYGQAMKIITAAKAVSFIAINNVMCSRASFLYKKQNNYKLGTLLKNTYNLTLTLSIGACFGIVGVAPIFAPLYFGPGYDKSILLLQILAAILPIICVSNVLGSIYYTPSGRRKQSSIYLVIGSAVNLVLNIPFIIFFKSVGAAIASILAELVITILYVWKSNKRTTTKELFHYTWKKLVAGGAMLGAIYGFRFLLTKYIDDISLFVALFSIGLFIYIVLLIILKDDIFILMRIYANKVIRKLKHQDVGEDPIPLEEAGVEGNQNESTAGNEM